MLWFLQLIVILSCSNLFSCSATEENDTEKFQAFHKLPFDTQTTITSFFDEQSSSNAMETNKDLRNVIYHEITHNDNNKYQPGQVSNIPSVHQFSVDPTKQHYRNIVDFREIWQIKRVMYFEKLGLHIKYNNSMNNINDINDIQLAIDLASVQNWLSKPGGSDLLKLQILPFNDPNFDVQSRVNFDICQFDFKPKFRGAVPICQRTRIETVTDMKLFSIDNDTSTMDFLALTSINLHGSQLYGTVTGLHVFPPEFTHLKHLNLSGNCISGTIDFAMLPNTLETLIVDEGKQPSVSWGHWKFETTSNIFSNLPALKIFHVPSLASTYKYLSKYTFISSQLPAGLQEFVIRGNHVQGFIEDDTLEDLPKSLRIFNVMDNRLSGTIKIYEISPLLQLQLLDVSLNPDLEIRITNGKSSKHNLKILYDSQQVKHDN